MTDSLDGPGKRSRGRPDPNRAAARLLTAALAFAAASGVWAQPAPDGPEFQVNVSTAGSQFRPSVAAGPSGGFVVIWQSCCDASTGVFGRLYDAAGAPRGGEFQVAALAPEGAYASSAAAAMDGAGRFVVAWDRHEPGTDAVLGRIYASDGSPLGAEFQVSGPASEEAGDPTVGMDASGAFVVAWEGGPVGGAGAGPAVFARRFDAAGAPLGAEFQVSGGGSAEQPSTAADGAGVFVVAWRHEDLYGQGIAARRYDGSGAPIGGEFMVTATSYAEDGVRLPSVAAGASGGFALSWQAGEGRVMQRLYDASGAPLDGVTEVAGGAEEDPSPVDRQVAADGAGNFVVVWTGAYDETPASSRDVLVRLFDGAGSALGPPARANTYGIEEQGSPSVARDTSGRFVVAWASRYQDGSGDGIFAQRFKPGVRCPDASGADQDTDLDGLCDSWETSGLDADGDGTVDLPLHAFPFNAAPDHKDLFVEIDYMDCAAGGCAPGDVHSHRPSAAALRRVVEAFAQAPVQNPDGLPGVTLHLIGSSGEVDEAVPDAASLQTRAGGPGAYDDFDDVKLGSPPLPCGSGAGTGRFAGAADRASAGCAGVVAARRLVFHYALFGHDQAETPHASALAELPGNDLFVSLGGWTPSALRAAGGRAAAEAAAFMHALGHNLGLRHGGGGDASCKPNYLSLMNPSLLYLDLDPERPLDYSRVALPDLDESSLDEASGIGGPAGRTAVYGVAGGVRLAGAGGAIDWSGDGSAAGQGIAADLSRIDVLGCGDDDGNGQQDGETLLAGFNDWSRPGLGFRSSADYPDGVARSTPLRQPCLTAEAAAAAAAQVDFDGDGVANSGDVCAAAADPEQEDADGDGFGDACDDCPVAPDAAQEDLDADGAGDACDADDDGDGVADAGDCAPLDGEVWELPGDPAGLDVVHAGGPGGIPTLTWSAPSAGGSPASLLYDVVRTLDAFDFGAGAACLVSGAGPATAAPDAADPPAGRAYYYLVRAENRCGAGPAGADSSGSPRPARACP